MDGCTISEAAERTGFSPSALRFYEQHGLVRPARTASGYRSYGDADLERLGFIGRAKGFGLSLDEITELYRADARGYALWMHVSPSVAAWLPGMGSAGSEVGDAVIGITTSQAIALAMMAGGVALWIWRARHGKAPETPLPEE